MRFITNSPDLSREEAEQLLLQPKDRVAVDVETVSVINQIPLGVAIAISSTVGFYFFNPRDNLLSQAVMSASTIITHNAKFDIPILRRLGIVVGNYEDTKILAYSGGMLDNSLEALSRSILHRECPSVSSQWRKKDSGNIAIDHVKMGGMSITHACNTYALWDILPKVPLYLELDKPCIELVIELEHWGVLIDQYQLTEVEQITIVKASQLEQELKLELGNINLASNPQVAKALQVKGVIGTRKTKAGAESVSDESLRPLDHPVANKLLEWRSEMKTLTTYVPAFRNTDPNGRIHTRYNYTTTGRWRSGDKEEIDA